MARPGTPHAPPEGRSDDDHIRHDDPHDDRHDDGHDRRLPDQVDPPYLYPAYRSTVLRAPRRPPLRVPFSPTELAGPWLPSLLDESRAGVHAADLTHQHTGQPLGERIIVHGRVLDSGGRPVPGALVEVWQANAAGRYAHIVDQHDAPLDPNFTGAGVCLADPEGRYRFVTIKPGAYPWGNHDNAWRPAHIHFAVMGPSFVQRLITQMYFPGDPLFAYDPIFNAIPTQAARESLIATFDLAATVPAWALGYQFDVVLGGRERQ
jgi:protocatechuate 3,4-dioxygenase beta subunit